MLRLSLRCDGVGFLMVAAHDSSADPRDLGRQIRILMLLDAAEQAGIAPISVRRLHTYAFLSNVLAPVWNTPEFDGRLLKRRGGPFYPAVQRDLDQLVGRGLAQINGLTHVQDEDNRWRLEGVFSLNYGLATEALEVIRLFPQHREIHSFLQEVAYAVSALSDSEFDRLAEADAAYSDAAISYENIVDFAEWRELNYSTNAARHFSSLSDRATPAELLHLYVRHLRWRLSGAR